MKLIKKPAKKIVKSLVGDVVHLELSYNDGRVIESYVVKASVVKVNRVTFDAKTENGNVYRMKFNELISLDINVKNVNRMMTVTMTAPAYDRPSLLDRLMDAR